MTPEDRKRPSHCEQCIFWKKDYGMWTFTGWTGMDRDDGHCLVQPVKVSRRGSDLACSQGESR